MGTTAEKLNYLLATKEEIKAAISEKGVFISTSPFRKYAQKIREIPQEVYVVENTITSGKADVQFLDYDGTLIHSYTKTEFLALTEMPVQPSKTGLICQGWNWSLEDAKSYVTDNGVLDIGATYITDDGKTRLYISTMTNNMTVPLYFNQSVANSVTIDWGDGSVTETLSGTGNVSTSHTYEEIGDYIITLYVAEDCTVGLGWNQGYEVCVLGSVSSGTSYHASASNILQKAEIGARTILHSGFSYCRNLKSVTIPVSITYCTGFDECYSLSSIVIPNGTTNISREAFLNCYKLKSVTIPASISMIDYKAFRGCRSLTSITLPPAAGIDGMELFYDCSSLTSVRIPRNVTSCFLQEAFCNCILLSSIVLPPPAGGHSMFFNCHSLSSVVLSDGITHIQNSAFSGCYLLSSISMPNSLKEIGNYAFANCFDLVSVVFPSSLTTIGNNVFNGCANMRLLDFSASTTVPVLGTNVFSNTGHNFKIVVPDELYDEWIAASNWSSVASKIVKASEFDG